MGELREFAKGISKTTSTLLSVLTFITVGLLIASFIVPPTGVIDPSVLKGASEIFAFSALWVIREAVKEGMSIKASHGDTTVEIGKDEEPATEEEEA